MEFDCIGSRSLPFHNTFYFHTAFLLIEIYSHISFNDNERNVLMNVLYR